MIAWFELNSQRRKEILDLVSNNTGLPAYAIEKDWWVTLCLKAIFQTQWAESIVFKGGTSLSKSWVLIERFSEDIDLVLDKEALGFSGDLSISKIKKLRKAAFSFISGPFKDGLIDTFNIMGVPSSAYELRAQASTESDKDPQTLELSYESVLEKISYIKPIVLIEIGARSLREPSSDRLVHSIIGTELPDQIFSGSSFLIKTVNPSRTFLEKAFLLHEEFSKPTHQIRSERMSRHLYDLDRLMDTEHGISALADTDLYWTIVGHREKFTPIRGVNYDSHHPSKIDFIPPQNVLKDWELDYKSMQESMIYGESKRFEHLIERMVELRERFRRLV